MAERFGYFNGIEYDEDFVALTNRTLVGTGVFYDQLAPSANGTMDVYIAEGSAMINGFLYNNSETMEIPISAADGSLDRKDSIFIRWDIAGRRINIVYSEGVASSNPEAPEIRRTDTFFDLKIAEIFVPAGSGAITMNNITDTRADDTVCGFVVGYDTADLQAILDQLNSVANRDYIVEQGTSGDWYYRKWNSGIAECWGVIVKHPAEETNNHGLTSLVHLSKLQTLTLPFKFVTYKSVVVTCTNYAYPSNITYSNGAASIYLRLIRPTTADWDGAADNRLNVVATGTWK